MLRASANLWKAVLYPIGTILFRLSSTRESWRFVKNGHDLPGAIDPASPGLAELFNLTKTSKRLIFVLAIFANNASPYFHWRQLPEQKDNVPKDIAMGTIGKRIAPWNRIEIINELSASFDYQNAKLKTDQKGGVFFSDSHYSRPIVTIRDKHY